MWSTTTDGCEKHSLRCCVPTEETSTHSTPAGSFWTHRVKRSLPVDPGFENARHEWPGSPEACRHGISDSRHFHYWKGRCAVHGPGHEGRGCRLPHKTPR